FAGGEPQPVDRCRSAGRSRSGGAALHHGSYGALLFLSPRETTARPRRATNVGNWAQLALELACTKNPAVYALHPLGRGHDADSQILVDIFRREADLIVAALIAQARLQVQPAIPIVWRHGDIEAQNRASFVHCQRFIVG